MWGSHSHNSRYAKDFVEIVSERCVKQPKGQSKWHEVRFYTCYYHFKARDDLLQARPRQVCPCSCFLAFCAGWGQRRRDARAESKTVGCSDRGAAKEVGLGGRVGGGGQRRRWGLQWGRTHALMLPPGLHWRGCLLLARR